MSIFARRVVPAAFLVEILLAGGNAVAIRFSNRELPPVWGASVRFTIAALLLLVLLVALKHEFPKGKALFGAMLFGLLQFAGAFGLAYYALVHIHAGLGQTLLALVPLVTLLLAVLQKQERLQMQAIPGTVLGLLGVGLISADPWRAAVPPTALVAILLSVVCFAQALIVVRRMPEVHPVALNAVGMVFAAIVLIALSTALGEPKELPQRPETWAALVYVILFGSVGVFLLHVFVAQNWGASRTAYVMVAIPLVTVTLSSWLDNEPITGGLLVGGLLIISGVYFGALRGQAR